MAILTVLSLALRLMACAWSGVLWRRLRDWRFAFLFGLLAVMFAYEGGAAVGAIRAWPGVTGSAFANAANLGVSILALLAVIFIELAIERERGAARQHETERAYFAHLFENAPEAIVILDNDSRVMRTNAEFEQMFGYGAGEVRGRPLDELIAPTHLIEEAHRVTRQVAEGERVAFETVRRRKDGTLLDVSVLGMPIRVEGGQVAVYGIYRDVTDRRRAERARRQSEERYHTILDTIEDGYYEVDTRGNLVAFNDALQRLLGYREDELRGMNNRRYMTDAEARRVYGTFNEVYRSGAPARIFDWEVIRSDGTRRIVEASVTPVRGADGGVVGFRGIVRDVTARKRTEQALRASEERYALAARGANDGLWDWDLVKAAVYFSPRWKAMLGYRDHEIGDQPEEWFHRVHPDDVGRLRKDLDTHLDGAVPHFQTEYRMLHRDGVYRWMVVRGVAERAADGTPARIAGSQTDIHEQKDAEERLIHDAFHDALTGLPNRALFTNLLDRSIGRLRRHSEYRFAVLFLDIDRFKVVNDSLGHMIGDQLLVAASRRLAACLRPGDTVARLGGDEFTVLLDDIVGVDDAIAVAERIQSELATAFTVEHHDVFTSASIGIALSDAGYQHPEEILRDADTAMYRAKSRGRACHEVFTSRMHTHAVSLLRLETDLRRALEREEFRLYYQPIISLLTGELTGFEALLRWAHPKRGIVAPVEFIRLAEETGLIIPIGQWVLWEACRQAEAWRQARGPNAAPLTMSINLSARQFAQATLVESVADALAVTGLPPTTLRLEITESILMDHAEASVRVLDQLRRSGVHVQVDDFGTGYSSLSYLHRFSLDALKIDRSFVAGLGRGGENTEIVRTIVTLARNLGMLVVAEGVETEVQRDVLIALGCEQAQGFLFSCAVDAVEAESLFARAEPV